MGISFLALNLWEWLPSDGKSVAAIDPVFSCGLPGCRIMAAAMLRQFTFMTFR
jgi:hypothetical protein